MKDIIRTLQFNLGISINQKPVKFLLNEIKFPQTLKESYKDS